MEPTEWVAGTSGSGQAGCLTNRRRTYFVRNSLNSSKKLHSHLSQQEPKSVLQFGKAAVCTPQYQHSEAQAEDAEVQPTSDLSLHG